LYKLKIFARKYCYIDILYLVLSDVVFFTPVVFEFLKVVKIAYWHCR